MDITGRVAVVTAGASGLGRHITVALQSRGARVVIGDLDADAGARAAVELSKQGSEVRFLAVDVTDDSELEELILAARRVGPLGVLVNNAGGWSPTGRQWPEAPAPDWSNVLELNLRTPMLATQLALPLLRRAGGGAVIHIGSSGGLGPDAYGSPEYGAAKAGLLRFTSSLRRLGVEGIRVSCVVPHWIGLPRAEREYEALTAEEQRQSGGLVAPETIAAEVVRLAEDDDSAGAIVALRAGRPPYPLDPAGIDPYWS
jgi:NAD(P)-dependent dehydrogenase (short-subunit alcohol dehydrogenase family)